MFVFDWFIIIVQMPVNCCSRLGAPRVRDGDKGRLDA